MIRKTKQLRTAKAKLSMHKTANTILNKCRHMQALQKLKWSKKLI